MIKTLQFNDKNGKIVFSPSKNWKVMTADLPAPHTSKLQQAIFKI